VPPCALARIEQTAMPDSEALVTKKATFTNCVVGLARRSVLATLLLLSSCADRPLPLPDTTPDLGVVDQPPDLGVPHRSYDMAGPRDLGTCGTLRSRGTDRRPYGIVAVATGDFDGNGEPDYATANQSDYQGAAEETRHELNIYLRHHGAFDAPLRVVLDG